MPEKGDEFEKWPDAFHFQGATESDQTTHFSILTKDGEAVVSTPDHQWPFW